MFVGKTSIGEQLLRDQSIDIPLSQGDLVPVLLPEEFSLSTCRRRQFLESTAKASHASTWKMWDSGRSERRVDFPWILRDDGPGVFLALQGTKLVGHGKISKPPRGDSTVGAIK